MRRNEDGETLFEYAEYFFEAAHKITEFLAGIRRKALAEVSSDDFQKKLKG